MTEHTAGPWTYDFSPEPGHASEFMVLGPRNAVLAYVVADEARDVVGPTVEANARLMAAAPDLLAELRGFLHGVFGGSDREQWLLPSNERIGRVRLLVAKVEGRLE